jgi:hypothetical protein
MRAENAECELRNAKLTVLNRKIAIGLFVPHFAIRIPRFLLLYRYTLSTRLVMPVNISQVIVPAFAASSEARIASSP